MMRFRKAGRRGLLVGLAFLPLLTGWPATPFNQPVHTKAYTQTFTASGSWQAPAGVTSVKVEAWGGGGAGGGRTANGASGGGGGGAYAARTITVVPQATYAYTIGAGGTGGTANGPDGGATRWDTGSGVTAAGGKGGNGTTTKGLGGAVVDSIGATIFRGGNGADGASSLGGGGGSGAAATANGNDASGQTGGAYLQDGGAGGAGGSNANGTAGSAFGGGGGGASRTSTTNRSGGNGAAGAIRITYNSASAVAMQTGYYIGDGSAAHAITGLGFAPDFVMLKADSTAGQPMFKTSLMADSTTAYVSAAADSTASFLMLDDDGFTLGNNAAVNSSGVRYTWIAFVGSNCTSSGVFCVGQYTGNGSSARDIGTGFQSDFAMVKRTTAVGGHFHTSSQPDNESLYFANALRDQTGTYIKKLNADNFSVGSNDNAAGGVYNYVAFKDSSGFFNQGSYTGDGTDNRTISGFGFTPDAVIVKNATNATAANTTAVLNTQDTYGDYSTLMASTAPAVNYIQALETDGIQVGTGVNANGSADTFYWIGFGGAAAPTSSDSFQMANGTYTGTGAANTISGLGFQPDLVIIKNNTTDYQVFRTSLMKGDSTAHMASATANITGGITAFTGDGFTVGTSTTTNTSGGTYQWQAFGGAWNPETRSGSNDFAIGAYMGNGIDLRDISGLPWQPDMVTIKRNGTTAGAWRSSAMSGDLTASFGATAEAANYVEALNANGFRVGTNAATNTAASLNYWFAFKSGNGFTTGTYTGNATDNRNITGLGFQPNLVWVKRNTAVAGVSRPSSLAGDNTQYFTNTANAADRVQSLISDGFQVGGNQTETNASGGVYRYAAWRLIPNAVISVAITSDGTVSYGTLGSGVSQSTLALSDSQTAKNDGNVAEDFNIMTDTPAGWTLGSSPGVNIFSHEFSSNSGGAWTKFITPNSYQTFSTNVLGNATVPLDLRITAPTSSTSSSQRTVTVTVQAVQH